MPENRTKTGQFAVGVSGNPGGRPRIDPEVVEILSAAGPEAARKRVKLMKCGDPRVELAASTAVLEALGVGKDGIQPPDPFAAQRPTEIAARVLRSMTPAERAEVARLESESH